MGQGDLNTMPPDLYFPMILRGSGFTDLHEGVSDDFKFLLRVDGLVEGVDGLVERWMVWLRGGWFG